MALTHGTTIGPYAVVGLIGQGGMGEVYRARDTKLDRDVALKVLPEAFTADPDRLARFEREAKVLASLNHPNIGTIHGLEESDGVKALVLELVEGPTLADRIERGPMLIDEALPIARQIADALEAAHEQGVIHRDLKPANIKVRGDGTVKVLDFGLAKALDTAPEGDPSQSPTLTAAATQMGVILGTAAYMSPEQARGKPVDKRADIWAFGVVLHEMLTGAKPFRGDDVSQTLARVIEGDPDWATLPSGLPGGLEAVLRRCFQKAPRQRLRDMGDMRLALDGAFKMVGSPSSGGVGASASSPVWRWPLAASIGVAALIVGSVGTALVVRDVGGGESRSVSHLVVPLATPVDVSGLTGEQGGDIAVSRDGRLIAYRAREGDDVVLSFIASTLAMAGCASAWGGIPIPRSSRPTVGRSDTSRPGP